jgi:hypothetical protein
MIEEIILRKQTPTAPNEWLYEDNQDGRFFCKEVYLGKHAEPWAECTEADRLAYEAEWAATHPEADTTAVVEPNGDMPAEALRAEEGAGV